MKKLLTALILISTLLLAGCTSASEEPPVTAESSDTVPAPKGPIDRKGAIKLASEYWGVKGGEVDELTGFKMNVFVDESPTPENNRYRIVLRWLVDGHYSTVDEVYIDADTGEIIHPDEDLEQESNV